LTLLVVWQEGHPACKKWGDGGGGHWLAWMEWCPAGWSVCLTVNPPLHQKVQKFPSGTGSPGWSRKKGRKMAVVVWWYLTNSHFFHKTLPCSSDYLLYSNL